MGPSAAKTLAIPSQVDQIPGVQDAILSELERFGYGEREIFAVRLAIEEALTNAIRHGNADDASKQVTVEYQVGDEAVRISIRDQGTGFEPDELPDPTCEENLTRPCGRGVLLIRSYMDEVAFNSQGNRVTMVKHRGEASDTTRERA